MLDSSNSSNPNERDNPNSNHGLSATHDLQDEDIPMSDMPEMPTSPVRTTHLPHETKEHAPPLPAARKVISRPDSMREDDLVVFNMAPAPAEQRNRLKSKIKQPLPIGLHGPSKSEDPDKHGEKSPITEQTVNKDMLAAATLYTETNEATPVPAFINSLISSEDKTGIQNAESFAVDCTNDAGDTSVQPVQDNIVQSQAESHVDTVLQEVEDLEAPGTEIQCDVEDLDGATPADEATQLQYDTRYNERDLRQDATAMKTTPKVHLPLSRTDDGFKISKSSVKHHTHTKHAPPSNGITSKTPSQEDLLFLLMHRTRHEKVNTQQQLEQLKKENAHLQGTHKRLQAQLENMRAERDDLTKDAEEKCAKLDQFEQRYIKLKNWALEMNKEYAEIRQQGSHLKATISSIQMENKKFWKPVQTALSSHDKAIAAVHTLKTDLRETRQTIHTLEGSLHTARETIAEKQGELRALQNAEAQDDTRFQQLVLIQEQFNRKTILMQGRLSKALSNLSKRVKNNATDPQSTRDIRECLQLVKEISRGDTATGAGLKEVGVDVAKLASQLKAVHENLEITLQSSLDVSRSCYTDEDVFFIKQTLQALKPDIAKLQELQQSNAMLQEKLKGDTALRQMVEESKRAADLRREEVQVNNNKLIDSLTSIREGEEQNRSRVANEAETQLSAATVRYNEISKQLEEKNTELGSLNRSIADVKQRVEDDNRKYHLKEEETRLEYQKAVTALKNEIAEIKRFAQADLERQLEGKNRELSELKQASADMQKKSTAVESVLKKLGTDKEHLDAQLKSIQLRNAEAEREINHHKKIGSKLSEELAAAKIIANGVSALTQRISEKERVIEKLEAKVGTIVSIQQNLAAAQTKYTNQENHLIELNEKLAKYEKDSRSMDSLEKTIQQHQTDLDIQRGRAAAAEKKAVMADDLTKSLAKKDTDVNQLRSSLEDVQKERDELRESNIEKANLEKRVEELQQELFGAKQQIEEMSLLERSNHHKDSRATGHDDQESSVGPCKTLQNLNQAGSDENEAAAVLGVLANQLQSQYTEDYLDELFTQNTNLSIASHPLPDTQGVPGALNEDCELANNELAQVIDPRIIVKATPTDRPSNLQVTANHLLSQTSVVPDSQEASSSRYDVLPPGSQVSDQRQRPSSPLSDVNEDYLDTDVEVDDIESEHDPNAKEAHGEDDDEVFDLPRASPQRPARFRVGRNLTHRASSIMSTDEMLLQASESGRHDASHGANGQHAHPATNITSPQSATNQRRTAQAAARQRANRTITQSHSEAADAGDITGPASILDIQANPRERNQPNSAVKRRASDVFAAINERQGDKRPKKPAGPNNRASTQQGELNTLSDPRSNNDGSGRARIGNTTNEATKKARKSRGRKPSKQDRYSARFGDSSQA